MASPKSPSDASLSCPTDETVALFVEGALSPEQERSIRLHVDGCVRCRQVLAGLVAPGEISATVAAEVERRYPLAVGEVVRGKYRIDGVLGAGGMATVFRAHHLGLGRAVAIKVMHVELLRDADATRRFSHEARAAAAIDHPNAVRILDIDATEGEEGETGLPFLVMEYLEGRDLGAITEAEGPMAFDRALRYVGEAASAVGAGHALGIVHRDLKPHNIFVTTTDLVKVVDFGLAKTLPLVTAGGGSSSSSSSPPASQHTKTSVMLGSPHYMSPEQVRSARSVDSKTDIWALGATLFHLLVGAPPFAAPNVYLLCARILSDEPPPLSRLREGTPSRIEDIVRRCMRKAANERFASIDELVRAIEDASLHLASDLESVATVAAATPKKLRSGAGISTTLHSGKGDDTVPMSYAETGTHGMIPGMPTAAATIATTEAPSTDPMPTEAPATPEMATPKKR